MGRPRGVLGHARALPRAAGAQGRAVPSVARSRDRVAMGTHRAARALRREGARRASLHRRARRAGDERDHRARVQRIAEQPRAPRAGDVRGGAALRAVGDVGSAGVVDGGSIARAPGVLAAADNLHARGAVRPLRHHRLRQAQRRLARPERVVLRPDARGRVERDGTRRQPRPSRRPGAPSRFDPVRRHRVRTRVPGPVRRVHVPHPRRARVRVRRRRPGDAPSADGRRRFLPRAHRRCCRRP